MLLWTRDYEQARSWLFHLNDKYALDGRDPNSVGGIMWCLGLWDRPWGNKPIWGGIRPMVTSRAKLKFDVKSRCASAGAVSLSGTRDDRTTQSWTLASSPRSTRCARRPVTCAASCRPAGSNEPTRSPRPSGPTCTSSSNSRIPPARSRCAGRTTCSPKCRPTSARAASSRRAPAITDLASPMPRKRSARRRCCTCPPTRRR